MAKSRAPRPPARPNPAAAPQASRVAVPGAVDVAHGRILYLEDVR